MENKIIILYNDGTVSSSKNPNNKSSATKIIFPNVVPVMSKSKINFLISSFKSEESECQNFDPQLVIQKFKTLMQELPISAAAFSPTIGGTECWVVIKKDDNISIVQAHNNPKYAKYIGKFKKPETSMFHVIQDVAQSEFDISIMPIMVGDTWHNKAAAESFGLPFVEASKIHNTAHNIKRTQ